MTVAIRIDPRMRARRIAVRRAEGRRRLRFLLVIGAVLTVMGAGYGLTRSPVLDVDRVRIDGVSGTRAEVVRTTAGVELGVPLFDLDTATVADRLEALPWIETASVEKRWPGTLAVDVAVRQAVAVVPAAGGVALVDAYGFVIGREPTAPTDGTRQLPMIDVALDVEVGGVHLAAGPGLAVVSVLSDDLGTWVDAVEVDDDRVGLRLVGGARVEMGAPVHLDDKVAAARAVLAGVELTCIELIDVSVADQTTVRRAPACLAATTADGADA